MRRFITSHKNFLIFFIIGSYCLLAQKENRKTLAISPFQNLKVSSNIEVNLIQAESNMLLVYGKNSDNVTVSIKNKTLKIHLIGGSFINTEKTKIDLYHSNLLDRISVVKGASLFSKYPINQTSLSIEAKANGIINLELITERLDTNISLGGKVYLKGKVVNHELIIKTSGLCEAEKLNTEQTKLISKGGAYAYLKTRSLLEASVYGGILREFGNPNKRITENRLGGKIYIEK